MLANIIKFVLPPLAAIMGVFAIVHVVASSKPPQRGVPPIDPPRSPYMHTVAGAGIIEPRSENINVGAPLAGVVIEVYVAEGDTVRAGDPLFRIDDRELRAQLVVRQADLAAAQAELQRLQQQPRPEEVPVQEALVAEAEAQLEEAISRERQTAIKLDGVRSLAGRGAVTEIELTNAQAEYNIAKAQRLRAESAVAAAKARLKLLKDGAWEADIAVAQAAVAQAQAQVEAVKTNLDRLVVRATINGRILNSDVHPGEFVGAPPGDVLMVIGDVDVLRVRVDIDEQDIPRFVPGAPAQAVLRGRNDLTYPLEFVRVQPYVIPKQSLTGDNRERVDTRVLQAIYALRPPAGAPIYVGQQVDVFIQADTPAVEHQPSSQ